jgi:hypothetical protein
MFYVRRCQDLRSVDECTWYRTFWYRHRLVLWGARFESVIENVFLLEVFKFFSSSSKEMTTNTRTFKYLTDLLSPRVRVRTARSVWWLIRPDQTVFRILTREIFFTPFVQTGSGILHSLIHCVGAFYRGKIASARSLLLTFTLPCTVHIKNAWSYTPASSICLHAVDKVKFALTLHESSYYWHYQLYTQLYHNWSFSTLSEVFLCSFLSCKASAKVYLAKTGHGQHTSY